ncbi:MAG: ATP-binding protein [Candidatus Hermodarchaeia archaeon]|jgi:CO dehydrogenase maturation factor
MKVAVAGKGGVGKTLVAGTIARLLGREGIRVLAVDADPTPTLASTLGISSEVAANIVPLTENDELVEERTGMDKQTYGGMFKLNPRVSDLAEKFGIAAPDNVTLLVAGTVTIGGAGCMCPAGALLKALIRHLIVGNDEAFVMDLEAGIENLGRGTSRGMDALITVVEPGQTSINTVERIQKLAHDISVDTVVAVGNKVMDDEDQAAIESTLKELRIPLLASIPFDKAIRHANLKGIAPLDYAPKSPAVKAIQSIIPRLRSHLSK